MVMAREKAKRKYSRKWFNPIFWIIDSLIKDGVVEIYIYGGKGSAKTISIAQTIGKRCYEKKQKAICFRKETSTIKTTLKPSFEKAIESVRLDSKYKNLEFGFRGLTRRKVFGITLKGIDKSQKVKGIEGYADTYHDELDQFNYEDYNESVNAHRGEVSKVKFFSWNPVDINSWIKTKVLDIEEWIESKYKLPSPHSFVKVSSDGQKALIKTVYQDNYWLFGSPCGTYGYRDEATINRYEKMRFVDLHWYNVNVLGEWGVIKPDNPFFEHFIREKHVAKNLQVNKFLPISLSFDFNVRNSVIAGQFSLSEHYCRILKELRLKSADIVMLTAAIVKMFGKDREYILTGDASGRNKSGMTKGNLSNWDLITRYFDDNNIKYTVIVPKSNLNLKDSRNVNNTILYFEDDYLIDEDGCPELIADIERMRKSTDGGLDKEHANRNDYGHLGDDLRYFNQNLLMDWYKGYDLAYDD